MKSNFLLKSLLIISILTLLALKSSKNRLIFRQVTTNLIQKIDEQSVVIYRSFFCKIKGTKNIIQVIVQLEISI